MSFGAIRGLGGAGTFSSLLRNPLTRRFTVPATAGAVDAGERLLTNHSVDFGQVAMTGVVAGATYTSPRAGGATEGIGSVDGVLANPRLLEGQSPGAVQGAVGHIPGWQATTLGQGGHAGTGWKFQQVTDSGNATGRHIRWHPGGRHHGPDAYWNVSGGTNKTSQIPSGPDDLGEWRAGG